MSADRLIEARMAQREAYAILADAKAKYMSGDMADSEFLAIRAAHVEALAVLDAIMAELHPGC
jgi:hypothetical protein